MKLITNKNKSSFRVDGNDLDIVIHKYVGCGENLYLTCSKLRIDCADLHTNDVNAAVSNAKEIIEKQVDYIEHESQKFLIDESPVEIVRW